MKEIKLSQEGKHRGKHVALVDDDIFDYINQWRWYVCKPKTSRCFYAVRLDYTNNRKQTWMHRVILNTPANMIVDHIDHNGLNNQRNNIRNCTRTQNNRNCLHTGKNKYMGIFHEKITRPSGKKYEYIIAHISINGITKRIGVFPTEEKAALAYDNKAKELFGEFANLNFK